MNRRGLLAAGAGLLASRPARGPAQPAADGAFSDQTVTAIAEASAGKPFVPLDAELPRGIRDLGYDAWRDIRFDRDRAFWRDQERGFQLEPFHRGWLYSARVALHEVADGRAVPFTYRAEDFGFGARPRPAELGDVGFAGMRMLYPLNRNDVLDELGVFLGASYFRGLGRGLRYGISARGLAIRTAEPRGEEFPAFRAFWFERPAPGAAELVVHALLDSPSVAGAFRFAIRPGESTMMDVTATLFARERLESFGIAPGTSMFLHAPHSRAGIDDFRPAVHDSDGLMVATSRGEQLWRPLANHRTLQLSQFADENPGGFGLMQRKRGFADYQDLEAEYHMRPGLWVEPLENSFGSGHVQLVEIPTRTEVNDNIVAFWKPSALLLPGQPLRLRYRLHWLADFGGDPRLGRFTTTLAGAGRGRNTRRFVLDAAGGALAQLKGDAPPPSVDLWANGGEVRDMVLQPNHETGGQRVSFELVPSGAQVELGLKLNGPNAPLTETWLYRWTG